MTIAFQSVVGSARVATRLIAGETASLLSFGRLFELFHWNQRRLTFKLTKIRLTFFVHFFNVNFVVRHSLTIGFWDKNKSEWDPQLKWKISTSKKASMTKCQIACSFQDSQARAQKSKGIELATLESFYGFFRLTVLCWGMQQTQEFNFIFFLFVHL